MGIEMEKENVSKIFDEDADLQTCYDKWKSKVEEIHERNKITVKKKNPRKIIKQLVKEKKDIKSQMKKANVEERKILIADVKEIDKQIVNEANLQFQNKIYKVVEELKCVNGINGAKIWDVLKKAKRRKVNPPTAVKDKQGNLIEEAENIRSRYVEHFQEILKPPDARNDEERKQEEIINTAFANIIEMAQQQQRKITTQEEVEEAVKELKTKKCADEWGWKNEIIIEGKEEMVLSLTKLFNRMENERRSPKQWGQVLVQTIPKKGSCLEMNNKRGLFITEIVSKVYERVLKNRNSNHIKEYVSALQTGGVKGRATVDNKIILSEIIRRNRKYGLKTYIVFGDAVKCFDKLWLKDSLVELFKAGCSPLDVAMIYELNKETEVTIITPSGKTEKIRVGEIVKQGTVLGPTLCCVETDQINNIGEDQTRPLGKEIVGILVFVDDVMSAGGVEDARRCIRNLREMERLKKFTYGLKKTNYMVMNTGKDEKKPIEEEVREGKVKECAEYEYLGLWVNQEANLQLHIQKKASKIKGEVTALKSLVSYHNVGSTYVNGRLQLYECCIVNSLLYDLEGWNKLSKMEIKKLESVQHKSLCSLLELPKTTPNIGLLNEVGIWTIEERLKYRKIMLYHNLINSDDDRLAKKVVLENKDNDEKDTFYESVTKMTSSLGIDINNIEEMSKEQLKNKMKLEIGNRMVRNINNQLHLTKMRFVKKQEEFCRKDYIKKMDAKDAIQTLRTRLNMIRIYGNYKGDISLTRPCPLCRMADDTTEHLITCGEVDNDNISTDDLVEENTEIWHQINIIIANNMEKRRMMCQ